MNLVLFVPSWLGLFHHPAYRRQARHEDTKDLYFLFLDILRAFVVKSYLKGELESQNNASDAISNKRNIEIDKETQSFLC